jgi:hypothetical protein
MDRINQRPLAPLPLQEPRYREGCERPMLASLYQPGRPRQPGLSRCFHVTKHLSLPIL